MAGIESVKGLFHRRTHVSQSIRGQLDVLINATTNPPQ